jgi:intracellular septation protein
MKDVFARLASDLFSAIVFLVIYLVTDNVVLATSVAIAGAIAQVIYARVKGQQLNYMTYASVALVVVLGTVTLLTNDPRFMLAKLRSRISRSAPSCSSAAGCCATCHRSSSRPFRNM